MTLLLSELAAALGGSARVVGPDVSVSDVARDSRDVEPGSLFAPLAGTAVDGSAYLEDARARGAVATLVREGEEAFESALVVDEPLRALGQVADLVLGGPLGRLRWVGVTGTNGKTTVSHLIASGLEALGHRVARIGTGHLRAPGIDRKSPFTTPFGDALARFAVEAADAGATHAVMEVSSHALALHRADAVPFSVAAYTNLTQDHLDFHADMADYAAAKARLFTELSPEHSVLHIGDENVRTLAGRLDGDVLTVGIDAGALRAERDADGKGWTLVREGERVALRTSLVGRHNVENLLVAIAALVAFGATLSTACAALERVNAPPGRLEPVHREGEPEVYVDYAHTPDAVGRALAALRERAPERLFVLVGCGGDRDRGKRPKMAAAAVAGADIVILTSDNPRSEDPQAILAEMEPGVGETPRVATDALAHARGVYAVESDRAAAIALATRVAAPGDIVLIAGKGDEDYQIVGDTRFAFDDRVEARRGLDARAGGAA